MKYIKKPEALLVLEDGRVFRGNAIGMTGTTTGEICFNTGMTGYQEIFTDPSYCRQIMVMTNAHIGNYGVNKDEVESCKVHISGLVVKNFSSVHSRVRSEGNLNDYLIAEKIVGISDIDTRSLVKHIRQSGAMNAVISSEILDVDKLKEMVKKVPSMAGLELSSTVSTREDYFWGDKDAPIRIAALDLGIKYNSLRNLASRGCYVKVFPMHTSYEEMLQFEPHGFFISNGPGDPAVMPETAATVKKILDNDHPMFGICMGHQILGKAMGLRTYKMHHGHRGINHPIKNTVSGKGEITSQNHGFAVDREEAEKHPEVEVTHLHMNDGSLAGIRVKNKSAFSVQYHPEAGPGPKDSRYLFDQFVEEIKEHQKKRQREFKV